jgi:pentatricopeptide repeat domain-containing protein 1
MLELRVQENVVALTALIKAVGGTPGMAEECHRLFRRMATGPARLKPNQATYRTMVGALREQGELAAALRVYESMRRLYPADNNEFEWLLAVAGERMRWQLSGNGCGMLGWVCQLR